MKKHLTYESQQAIKRIDKVQGDLPKSQNKNFPATVLVGAVCDVEEHREQMEKSRKEQSSYKRRNQFNTKLVKRRAKNKVARASRKQNR